MIRFILKWLGYAFIAFGIVSVLSDIATHLFTLSQVTEEQQSAHFHDINAILAQLRKFSDYLIYIGLGAVTVGIYELLIKADMVNVTPMKAKKDLGNWPPSV